MPSHSFPDAESLDFYFLSNPEFAVPAVKAANTCRIFVFGSSAAEGKPQQAFSFWRILYVMLRSQYPHTHFEVYSAATAGMNSHVMRACASSCAKREPDVFVVYMGNNEFVGPFGLASVIYAPHTASLAWIHARLLLSDSRLFQFLQQFTPPAPQMSWDNLLALVRRVDPDNPRIASVYGNFARNLAAICGAGHRAGAAVVLATVGCNLRDWGPMVSEHRSGLAPDQLDAWNASYQAGIVREAANDPKGALEGYAAAAAIDDRFAELQFRMGRCHAALSDIEQARSHYVAARERDLIRMRADSGINGAIVETAEAWKAKKCYVADAEARLAAQSPQGIPGRECFYDFVHLTFEGNYAVACAVFEQVARALPEAVRAQRSEPPQILSPEECKRRLGLTDPVLSLLLAAGPHLTPGIDATNALQRTESLAWFEARRSQIDKETGPDPIPIILKGLRDALDLDPEDYPVRALYALALLKSGEKPLAQEQARALVRASPALRIPRFLLHAALEDSPPPSSQNPGT